MDSLILVGWVVGLAILRPWPESVPGVLRGLIWFAPVLIAEPILVFSYGRTFGQRMLNLRVQSDSTEPLRFHLLCARHISKFLLGGLSVLYTFFSPNGQSLHDSLFHTSVVSERRLARPQLTRILKSPIRAFIVSIAWSTLAGLLAAVIFLLVLGFLAAVLGYEIPSGPSADAIAGLIISIPFLYAQFRVLHRGASGRLPGTGPVIERAVEGSAA